MARPPLRVLVALLLGSVFVATDAPDARTGVTIAAWGCVLAAACVALLGVRRSPAAPGGEGGLRPAVAEEPRTPPTGGTRRGIGGDLAAVFALALAVRVVWALLVPPWLAPDEADHYAYASHLVEAGRLPYPPDRRFPFYSLEMQRSWGLVLAPKVSFAVGGGVTPALPFLPVAYDYAAARDYEGVRDDRRSAAGANATSYPPLYYLYTSLPYRVAYDTPVLTRLYAMRLGSAALGAVGCAFGYLFAWEMYRSRLWGMSLGLCMGLMPMHAFITASVNNDGALFPVCTALCWLLARFWRRSPVAPGLMLALGAAMGLIVLIKPTGFGVLLTVAALVLLRAGERVWRERGTLRAHALGVAASVIGAACVSVPWLVYRRLVIDAPPSAMGDGAFAWLPRLLGGITARAAATPAATPGATPGPAATRTYSLLDYAALLAEKPPEHWHWLFVRSFWGIFGWLDEPMPAPTYAAITVFVAIGLIGAAGVLLFRSRERGGVLLALALVVGQAGFLFLGADYYEGFRRVGFEFGLQGRYLLPILAPCLLVLLSGWHYLLGGRRIGLRLAPVAMFAVLLVALGTVLATYYGVASG